MAKGAYIAIEGISGSGKSTLVQMLARELQASGRPVLTVAAADKPNDLTAQTINRVIEDPRYPLTTQAEVLLYNAARAQSLEKIRASIDAGVTCIVDQSYLSVLVHEYYGRGSVTDYNAADEIIRFATGTVQPDLIVVLDAPVNTVRARLPKGATPEFSEPQLERVRAGYLWEAKQRNIPVVYANDPVETVFEHVKSYAQNVIDNLKPSQEKTSSKQEVTSVAEVLAGHPVSTKTSETLAATPDTPTSPTKSDKRAAVSSSTYHLKQASALLHASLAQASVAYPVPTKGRPDKKGANGRYSYYVPDGLQGKLRSSYTRTLNQIFDTYGQLHTKLTAHVRATSNTPKAKQTPAWHASIESTVQEALQGLVPLAAASSLELTIPSGTVQEVITRLYPSSLPEARGAAQQLLAQVREAAPEQLPRRFTETLRAEAEQHSKTTDAVAQIAQTALSNRHADTARETTLVAYSPRNEMDLVADMLYEHSDMPIRRLRDTVSGWPYKQKLATFEAYKGATPVPGDAFTAATYIFDLTSDYCAFNDICTMMNAERTAWQTITPRIGYDTPEIVEQAGLSEVFAQCFDLSLLLHSELHAASSPVEAQYTVLQGHKLQWTASFNARSLFSTLRHAPSPSARGLLNTMRATVAEVHPLLAEGAPVQPK